MIRTLAVLSACWPLLALAETGASDTVQSLRAELERMKAEQAARAAEMQRLEERLAALEAAAAPAEAAPAPPPPAVASAQDSEPSRFKVSGDFRLRYEYNAGAVTGDWDRGALRGRLGATYSATDAVTIGARLATGDPDDPNSSDVTFSNFADDFDVSLDLAYAAVTLGDAKLWGGKFLLPFTRTDLVWDGDVNPQGAAAAYRRPLGPAIFRVSGLYFAVDQTVAGSDSSMVGGQVGLEWPATDALKFDLAVAEYDYSLGSVAGADAGDLRSNVIGPDGRYVSDFDLFNVLGSATYGGWRWPVKLTGDYVVNRGANVPGAMYYQVSPGFFRTLGTPLVAGRDFASSDTSDRPSVVVVNQAFVRRFFGSSDGIGRRFRSGPSGPWWEVVGVVADGKYQSLGERPQPVVFYSTSQWYNSSTVIVARTKMDEAAALERGDLHVLALEDVVEGVLHLDGELLGGEPLHAGGDLLEDELAHLLLGGVPGAGGARLAGGAGPLLHAGGGRGRGGVLRRLAALFLLEGGELL